MDSEVAVPLMTRIVQAAHLKLFKNSCVNMAQENNKKSTKALMEIIGKSFFNFPLLLIAPQAAIQESK
jgi:hypothetical protein